MLKAHIKNLRILLLLTLLWSISSCTNNMRGKQKVLRHVVCFQFKNEISEEAKAQAIKIFADLKGKIPEIKKFEGGKNINTNGQSKGLTHCFVLTFESEAARDIYLPHPEHMKVVEKNKPLFNDLMVIDYWGED